ncbi:histidine phosphatase family protein [Bifidobacterium breve]|uniref:histidine phosphatase family protein n=1 Tax=Bifidobacterium breve TaxID=1685 RepID=UPI003B9A0BA2
MSEQHMDGTVAVDASCGKAGFLVLLRHGQTFWSESGQHTGRTNIPLTEVGKQQAMDAGARLREAFPEGFDPECVFSSPLKRACQTAELAGFAQHGILDGIAEWDYGRAEGRTRQQVSEASGFSWDVWRDGPRSLTPTLEGDWVDTLPDGEQVNVHSGAGETLDEVAARARAAIEEVTPLLQSGRNVLLVAHAHILRILTSQWLNVDPQFARLLRLDTAHYSVLSVYKGDNVIERWNA